MKKNMKCVHNIFVDINVKKNMKCVHTIFFDIRGYFEITVFEIYRVNCSIEAPQDQSDRAALFAKTCLPQYLEVFRHVNLSTTGRLCGRLVMQLSWYRWSPGSSVG